MSRSRKRLGQRARYLTENGSYYKSVCVSFSAFVLLTPRRPLKDVFPRLSTRMGCRWSSQTMRTIDELRRRWRELPERERNAQRLTCLTMLTSMGLSLGFGVVRECVVGTDWAVVILNVYRGIAALMTASITMFVVAMLWCTPPRYTIQEDNDNVKLFLYNKIPAPNLSSDQCYICMDNGASTQLEPCEHRGICLRCVLKLQNLRCPLCRDRIVAVLFWRS